jgi:hypothetical protein
MTVRGKIKNGKVVLDEPDVLTDGTEVEVRPLKKAKRPGRSATPRKTKSRPRSLAERYARFIGKARGLPPDMSGNLDHYLYGLPKRK